MRLDENGTVIDREEFYPYGESRVTTFTKKGFRFTGKDRDSYSFNVFLVQSSEQIKLDFSQYSYGQLP